MRCCRRLIVSEVAAQTILALSYNSDLGQTLPNDTAVCHLQISVAQVAYQKGLWKYQRHPFDLQGVASMGNQDDLNELPQAPHNLAGESIDRDKAGKYHIQVSNASGYLCHIHVEVSFPPILYCILQHRVVVPSVIQARLQVDELDC